MQPPVPTAMPLLIFGASARAAAFSAIRGSLQPITADLFADSDLTVRCRSIRLEDYPDSLPELAETLPPGPWMYTGALENRPDVIESVCGNRELYGNSGDAVTFVRNPFHLAKVFRDQHIPFPQVRLHLPEGGVEGWLNKPILSSAGYDIWHATETGTCATGDRFHQRFIAGAPCSALFVGAGGQVALIGVTRQLVGTSWTGASGFRYAGSVGPLAVEDHLQRQFERIGGCLASQFHLMGLFGVDAVMANDTVWPIEVNPRFTASAELFDWAFAASVVRWHRDACRDGQLPSVPAAKPEDCYGKAILYAQKGVDISDRFTATITGWNQEESWPVLADIPHPGQVIQADHPILTVFAAGPDEMHVLRRLRRLARDVTRLLAT